MGIEGPCNGSDIYLETYVPRPLTTPLLWVVGCVLLQSQMARPCGTAMNHNYHAYGLYGHDRDVSKTSKYQSAQCA